MIHEYGNHGMYYIKVHNHGIATEPFVTAAGSKPTIDLVALASRLTSKQKKCIISILTSIVLTYRSIEIIRIVTSNLYRSNEMRF